MRLAGRCLLWLCFSCSRFCAGLLQFRLLLLQQLILNLTEDGLAVLNSSHRALLAYERSLLSIWRRRMTCFKERYDVRPKLSLKLSYAVFPFDLLRCA